MTKIGKLMKKLKKKLKNKRKLNAILNSLKNGVGIYLGQIKKAKSGPTSAYIYSSCQCLGWDIDD